MTSGKCAEAVVGAFVVCLAVPSNARAAEPPGGVEAQDAHIERFTSLVAAGPKSGQNDGGKVVSLGQQKPSTHGHREVQCTATLGAIVDHSLATDGTSLEGDTLAINLSLDVGLNPHRAWTSRRLVGLQPHGAYDEDPPTDSIPRQEQRYGRHRQCLLQQSTVAVAELLQGRSMARQGVLLQQESTDAQTAVRGRKRGKKVAALAVGLGLMAAGGYLIANSEERFLGAPRLCPVTGGGFVSCTGPPRVERNKGRVYGGVSLMVVGLSVSISGLR